MRNNTPDLHSSFIYNDKTILLDWFTVTAKDDIPDLAWSQVYAVANLDGKAVLVTSSTSPKPYNLPGGGVEKDETIEMTLRRELIEECNMRVLSWEPIGYQLLTEPNGKKVYQFRVYAEVEKIGEFVSDPGGGVTSNTLIAFENLEETIQYGDVGSKMIELSKNYFKKV